LGGATRGARWHKGHKVKMRVLEETGAREGMRPPRLSVCVLEFVVQNHLDLAIHPKFVLANKTHPNSTQSPYSKINFVCLVTG
jgi:hypothetical protein